MNIHQLEYLLACIEYGSFKDAAEQMCVTPQAISKSISSLEVEISAKLFYRNSKSVIPTETAMMLAKMSEDVVDSFRFIEDIFKSADQHSLDEFKMGIAYYPYHGGLLSDDALAQLRNSITSFKLETPKYPQHKCEEALVEGLIDAAITVKSIDYPNIYSYKLADIALGFTMSKNNHLSNKSVISYEDLCDVRIAEPMNVKSVYSELKDAFRMAGCILEFVPIPPTKESYMEFINNEGIVLGFENNSLLTDADSVIFKEDFANILPNVPFYYSRSKSSSSSACLHVIEMIKNLLSSN